MKRIPDAPEVRRLLNPGFISLVIAFAAEGFEDESETGLPFLLALTISPLLLHRETREKLPKVVTTKMSEWTRKHPHASAQIPTHVQEFVFLTKRALVFGSNVGTITVNANGSVVSRRQMTISKASSFAKTSIEIPEIIKKAYTTGRWLAHAGTVPTIYSILGMGLVNEA